MDRPTVKPPFAYYGGKMALASEIAALLPAHQHYVEPFAGSLAVLLAKPRSRAETVNDLDGALVTFWRVLRDNPAELERAAAMTPHSRGEFADAWEDAPDCEIEQARRVWVRLTQSRGHSLKRTGWKFNRAPEVGHAAQRVMSFADRMPQAAERLRGVTLENRDALDVIRDYGTEPTACIYADPPYVGSTRATNYGVEMVSDAQHEAFAEVCHNSRAPVVISGYASPLYARLFEGWHHLEIKAPTTLSGDTDRVEVLWSNVPIGEPDLFADLGGEAS